MEYALIVAGGKGVRMESEVPKQFIEIAGKPILLHTISAFLKYSEDIQIIVVLPEKEIGRWNQICENYHFDIPHKIIAGGPTRFQSVKNGLKSINEDGLVAIHDGVRPLVDANLIEASFRIATLHGSAVAAVRLKESIRKIDQQATTAVDRSKFRLIQTPQTFQVSLIKDAYVIEENQNLTDDASVAELAGNKISLFEGSYNNIKITTTEDLELEEVLIRAK